MELNVLCLSFKGIEYLAIGDEVVEFGLDDKLDLFALIGLELAGLSFGCPGQVCLK
jgi:hypothetical protein